MSAEANKAVIRRWIEQAWNRGHIDIADELYSPHFIARDIDEPDRMLHGTEDIKHYVIRTRSSFPDIHFTIDYLLAEGDKVVGAFTIHATHKGRYGTVPPTGKQVIFKAIDIWRFEGNKIAERCLAIIDRLDLMQQLGAVSVPAKGHE